MTVDLRTRVDAPDASAPEADEIFGDLLPDALARSGTPVGVLEPVLRPLCIEVGDRCWTLQASSSGFEVVPGLPTAADRWSVLRVSGQQLQDLVTDQLTPIALMTAGALDHEGGFAQLLDWWVVLRHALDDVPPAWREPLDLPDDLHRSFTIDDDPSAIRSFLEAAGFVHLRSVFTQAEMAQISADMDAAASRYAPGDGRSWWAATDRGDRLVRMQGFDEHAASARQLLRDARFAAIGGLTGDGHVHQGLPGNRVEALFKPLGVTKGISDIPWHKDCSLGRHSYDCCSLTAGVSVTGAGPTSGQLRVIAGSHRRLTWPSLLDVRRLGLPDVALATETGDVTVHLSCTLHMAQAPTERERRVLYTSFRLPQLDEAAAAAGRDRLLAAREAAPTTTSQPAT